MHRFLVVRGELSDEVETSSYSPMNTTGLFLDFASLDTLDTAILKFANRWGLLTNGEVIISTEADEGLPFPGEPRSIWIDAILKMKYLVKVWRMAEGNDRSALQQQIEWDDVHGLHGFYSDGEGTGFARYWTP